MTQQTTLNQPAKYTIDTHKVEKYFPRLLNGEAYKLDVWLPNLLSKGGITDRERYDWRNSQFRKKEPQRQNTKYTMLAQKLEQIRLAQDSAAALVAKAKQDFIAELAEYKAAVDDCYEKNKAPL